MPKTLIRRERERENMTKQNRHYAFENCILCTYIKVVEIVRDESRPEDINECYTLL